MKNVINYYYNFFPMEIHQKNNEFYFKIEKKDYLFTIYDKNLNKIEDMKKMVQIFKYVNVQINNPVINILNSYITYYNNKSYVLLQINEKNTQKVEFEDIIKFGALTYGVFNEFVKVDALSKAWINKIDYFEYQVNQFGIKYPNMRYSFNYFIGLAENALIILNEILTSKIPIVVSHERIKKHMTKSNLYNSLSFIFDSRVRDIGEYIKEKMFDENVEYLIRNYFSYTKISNEEAILLFSRILFPTYYFDICEEAFEIENDDKIKAITEKVITFESNLKQIYLLLRNNYNIMEIEWLRN